SDRSPELQRLHLHKAATPTMGGLFLVAGIVAASLLLCNWHNSYVPIVLVNLLGMATIGAVDDLAKLAGKADGITARPKFIAQLGVAGIIAAWLYSVQSPIPGGLDLQIPIAGHSLHLGAWFLPLAILVIVGSSNSVNLTDGLDGLASGCLLSATAAIAGLAYVAGHAELANYLGIAHMPEAGEVAVIGGSMI